VINVDQFVKERGIKVEQASDLTTSSIGDTVTVRLKTRDGHHDVVGEVGADGKPRIMAIDGYRMNLVPEGPLVMIFNNDEPGVIGLVGTIFGNHKLNIADMMLSRQAKTALMVLKLDQPIPEKVLKELASHQPPLTRVLPVTLP
jgi:D-3-phosphoglycerate dehydrogenase